MCMVNSPPQSVSMLRLIALLARVETDYPLRVCFSFYFVLTFRKFARLYRVFL